MALRRCRLSRPSGYSESHGGDYLNVSGSKASCREERGRCGPPVAGQVTGSAGAPPAGGPGRTAAARGRQAAARGSGRAPEEADPPLRPPRSLGPVCRAGPRGERGSAGLAAGARRSLPPRLCVSAWICPAAFLAALAAPSARPMSLRRPKVGSWSAEVPPAWRAAFARCQGAGQGDDSFHHQHCLPKYLHPFALFCTL